MIDREYVRVHLDEIEPWIDLGYRLVSAEGYGDGTRSSALLVREVKEEVVDGHL